MTTLGLILAALAMLILLVASLGILRLPDALSRQHAVTKAATLGVNLFAISLMLVALASGWSWVWILKLFIIMLILLIAVPIASHALAKSGLSEHD
jgi:multicomponent Na+:H+ antiporter subunit G